MKRFNYSESQKKSVLTFALIAALGFSLSAPFQTSLSGSTDLASNTSESKEEKIAINGEVYDVTIIKKSSDTVKVIYDVALEGKTCETDDCLTGAVLNVKYEDDIAAITAALQKKLSPNGQDLVEEIPDSTIGDNDDPQIAKDEKAFENLRKQCDSKRSEKNKAECLSDGMIRILKAKKTDGEVALDFYNSDLRPVLEEMSALDGADTEGFVASTEILKDLHAKLPGKYNAIREDAIATSLEMAKAARAAAKSDAQRLQIDTTLLPYLQNQQTEGLHKAVLLGYVNTQDSLTLTQQLIDGQKAILVSENPVTGDVQTTVTTLNDLIFQNRAQNPGRGAPIVGVVLSTTRAFDASTGNPTGATPALNTGFSTQNLPTSRSFVP